MGPTDARSINKFNSIICAGAVWTWRNVCGEIILDKCPAGYKAGCKDNTKYYLLFMTF